MTETARTTDLSREELIHGLRELRPRFEAIGVSGMTLFGSRSRGDNRPDSDIDLLIDVAGEAVLSLFAIARIEELIEERLGLPASVVTRRGASGEFLLYSLPDHVLVF